LLRSSVKIRKATDEFETSPGLFEGDTVAHCGPTFKAEFAHTLNPRRVDRPEMRACNGFGEIHPVDYQCDQIQPG
jgi:hypothetical protein